MVSLYTAMHKWPDVTIATVCNQSVFIVYSCERHMLLDSFTVRVRCEYDNSTAPGAVKGSTILYFAHEMYVPHGTWSEYSAVGLWANTHRETPRTVNVTPTIDTTPACPRADHEGKSLSELTFTIIGPSQSDLLLLFSPQSLFSSSLPQSLKYLVLPSQVALC